jgi:hypothetical protein
VYNIFSFLNLLVAYNYILVKNYSMHVWSKKHMYKTIRVPHTVLTIHITKTQSQTSRNERVKETREMLHEAAALGLGIYQDLIGYEAGVRGNIDREVDEWTSANQL